jgi:hypothetical protein
VATMALNAGFTAPIAMPMIMEDCALQQAP